MSKVIKYTMKLREAHSEGISLVLFGPSPCGRTFWLSYLLRYALFLFGNDATYRYVTANDLTSAAFNDEEKYQDILCATFVGLDDVDSSVNNGTVQVLSRFLRERQKHRRVTFTAVSLTDQECRALLGPSVWRMLTTDSLRLDCPGIGDKVASMSQSRINRFLGE